MFLSSSGVTRRIASSLSAIAALLTIFVTRLASAETETAPQRHHGGEASLVLPDLSSVTMLGMSGTSLLMLGIAVTALGLVFALITLVQVKNLPAHKSMTDISYIIWETCKT